MWKELSRKSVSTYIWGDSKSDIEPPERYWFLYLASYERWHIFYKIRLHQCGLLAPFDSWSFYNTITTYDWIKTIWASSVASKINLFLWKIVQRAPPHSLNLQRKDLLNNTSCQHCWRSESVTHIFFSLPFLEEDMWSYSFLAARPNDVLHLWSSSYFQFYSHWTNSDWCYLLIDFMDLLGIRTKRNKLLFENKSFSSDEILTNYSKISRMAGCTTI